MNWFEVLSFILNVLLTGGLVTLLTMRSIRRKSMSEAKRVDIDNETAAMENFQKYIVDPLKKEVEDLRKAVTSYKREMAKFRKAIEAIGDCEYKDNCPVKNELKDDKDEKLD